MDFIEWTSTDHNVSRVFPDNDWIKRMPELLKDFWHSNIVLAFTATQPVEDCDENEDSVQCGNAEEGIEQAMQVCVVPHEMCWSKKKAATFVLSYSAWKLKHLFVFEIPQKMEIIACSEATDQKHTAK